LSGENEGNTTEQEIDPKEMMIKELEDKNKELNDKYLRLFSEFDNFRKRNYQRKH
jgi:molecular chaperone GrpE